MFIILMYGGRIGIHLGYSLPCLSCPYVAGCGGNCYLMALQHHWGFGIAFADILGMRGLEVLFKFLVFLVLVSVLSKIWCGWICPFCTFQDWITLLRKKLHVREA
ncbi:MAG: 4Fe-4S binding protein, partial [Desulfobacteraceae bacterium]|nr:4Fe-4S binding protein [Desulfobacteraceae bacterium]